jgi:hypothetical protein
MFGLAIPSRQPCVSRPAWPVASEEHCRAHRGSEERSQDLLRQWLSPDQAEQYDGPGRRTMFEHDHREGSPALNRGDGRLTAMGSRGTLRRWLATSRSGTSRRVSRGKRLRPNTVGRAKTSLHRAKTVPLEVCLGEQYYDLKIPTGWSRFCCSGLFLDAVGRVAIVETADVPVGKSGNCIRKAFLEQITRQGNLVAFRLTMAGWDEYERPVKAACE